MMHAKRKHGQRGVAAVEAAITLPLLLLLLLAIAEVGTMIMSYNEMTKSLRDAARYLAGQALLGTTGVIVITPGLADATRNLAVYGNRLGTGDPVVQGLTTGDIAIEDLDGVHVRVSAAYTYRPLLGSAAFPSLSGSGPISVAVPLRGSATMRAL